MVVPDKEELPKQAFLASNPGRELTSKWYVIVLSTTCSNAMVEGLSWRGIIRRQNFKDEILVLSQNVWNQLPSGTLSHPRSMVSSIDIVIESNTFLYLCHSVNFVYSCVGGYLSVIMVYSILQGNFVINHLKHGGNCMYHLLYHLLLLIFSTLCI